MFSLYHYYLPLGKSLVLHMKKTCIPITQGCFVTSLVEMAQLALEKKKKGESLQQRHQRTMDKL